MSAACRCGCTREHPAHAMVAALAQDDVDGALRLGLLDSDACDDCSDDCRGGLIDARDARLRALQARERYRARDARLQRRVQERAALRNAAPVAATPDRPAVATAPALPAAAAAALARAKAKAAERHKP
ncbi:hypothetical protein [Lysobacter silvisoli]